MHAKSCPDAGSADGHSAGLETFWGRALAPAVRVSFQNDSVFRLDSMIDNGYLTEGSIILMLSFQQLWPASSVDRKILQQKLQGDDQSIGIATVVLVWTLKC